MSALESSINENVVQSEIPDSPLLALIRRVPARSDSISSHLYIFNVLEEDQYVPSCYQPHLLDNATKDLNSTDENVTDTVPKTPKSSKKSSNSCQQTLIWTEFSEKIPCSPTDGVVPSMPTPIVTPAHTPILNRSLTTYSHRRLISEGEISTHRKKIFSSCGYSISSRKIRLFTDSSKNIKNSLKSSNHHKTNILASGDSGFDLSSTQQSAQEYHISFNRHQGQGDLGPVKRKLTMNNLSNDKIGRFRNCVEAVPSSKLTAQKSNRKYGLNDFHEIKPTSSKHHNSRSSDFNKKENIPDNANMSTVTIKSVDESVTTARRRRDKISSKNSESSSKTCDKNTNSSNDSDDNFQMFD